MISHEKQEMCNSFIFTLHKLNITKYNVDEICGLIEYYEWKVFHEQK